MKKLIKKILFDEWGLRIEVQGVVGAIGVYVWLVLLGSIGA